MCCHSTTFLVHCLPVKCQSLEGKEIKQIKANIEKIIHIMNMARYGDVNTTKKFYLPSVPNDEL